MKHRYATGMGYGLLVLFALAAHAQDRSVVLGEGASVVPERTLAATKANVLSLQDSAASCLHSKPESAFRYARAALRLAESMDYGLGVAMSCQYLGQIYYHQGAYQAALQYHLRSAKQYEQLADPVGQADNANCLGVLYYATRQSERARPQHDLALALYRKANDRAGEARTLGCLGHLFEKSAQYDSALVYQQRALTVFQEIDSLGQAGEIYENLGSIYEDLEDYDQAQKHFETALRLHEQSDNQLAMLVNLNNLGDVHRKTGRWKPAEAYTLRALRLARSLGEKYQESSALRDLAKLYHQTGRAEEAFDLLEEAREVYVEIYTEESSRQLALLQTLFELESKDQQIALLEQEKDFDLLLRGGLLAGMVLTLALGATVVSRQRLKFRHQRRQADQHEQLLQQQLALAQMEQQNAQLSQARLRAEVENKQLREAQLQQDLTTRSQELNAQALHLMQKNQMLADLKRELRHLEERASGQPHAPKVRGMVRMIDKSFSSDEDWETFGRTFAQVHPDFFDKLRHQYPDLTQGETRLAALMRLGLGNKDIASILVISPASLRIARYRLRKKMALDGQTDLSAHLLAL